MSFVSILKTEAPFKEVGVESLEVTSGSTENISIEPFFYDKYNTDAIKFSYEGNELIVREDYYERIQEADCEIKLDFTNTKPRRVKRKKAQRILSGVDSSPNKADVVTKDFDPESLDIRTTRLSEEEFDPKLFVPIKTGTYFDNFCSRKGGIMPGINIMMTGDPGVGKSSNLMDIQLNIHNNNPDKKVLYISGEMTMADLGDPDDGFLKFYPGLENCDFFFISEYLTNPEIEIPVWQAFKSILHQGWDVVILDSIVEVQTMVQDELGLSGRKAERWLLDEMAIQNRGHNKLGKYTTFLAIQQKNKSGVFVGSNRLKHMTAAFLELKWCDEEKGKRYMIFQKNRKGKEKVKLYYAFGDGEGIKYSEMRHRKELEILETIQSSDNVDAEALDEESFYDIFDGVEAEEAEMEEAMA